MKILVEQFNCGKTLNFLKLDLNSCTMKSTQLSKFITACITRQKYNGMEWNQPETTFPHNMHPKPTTH